MASIADGEAEKVAVVKESLDAFCAQFDALRANLHKLVPHFGELQQVNAEGERGEDELIRLETIAATRLLSKDEWKRQRDLEEILEV